MELDIDFENYKVPGERKKEVRSFVEALKQETWVKDLKTLVAELGTEETAEGEPTLPGMLEETKARIYRAPEGSPAYGFEVMVQGTELKVYFERRPWVEVHFLPKGDDFLVFYVEEASFEAFREKLFQVDETVMSAKGKKSGRAAQWKARFEAKNAAAALPAPEENPPAESTAEAPNALPGIQATPTSEVEAEPTRDARTPVETIDTTTTADLNAQTVQEAAPEAVEVTLDAPAAKDGERAESDEEGESSHAPSAPATPA